MVLQRALTKYQKVQIETIYDEDAEDIELLPNQKTSNHEHRLDDDIECLRLRTPPIHPKPASDTQHEDWGRFPFRVLRLGSWRPFLDHHLTGWRMGVSVALIGTILVCMINTTLTIYIVSRGEPKMRRDCKTIRDLNVLVHLVVNALSTLLLGASNYCMHVLSAPTREELVKAHAKRVWLHIGIPSFRNLRHIARGRACMWLALLLSSMPLHLFFNSVVFTTLQANDYLVVPATQSWMSGAKYDTSGFFNCTTNTTDLEMNFIRLNRTALPDMYQMGKGAETKYNNLSVEACFKAYDSQYLPKLGNVYIVHDEPPIWRNPEIWWPAFHLNDSSKNFTWTNNSTGRAIIDLRRKSNNRTMWDNANLPLLVSKPEFYQSNGWRCPSHTPATCDIENSDEVPIDRSQWRPFERPVLYCLAEEVSELCSLNFSISIAIVVIVSNIVKIACMALTLLGYRQHLPLVTLGDAIAHFLDHPDPQTKGQCLHSRGLVEAQWNWEHFHNMHKAETEATPEKYSSEHRRWSAAPRRMRWFITYVSFVLAIIIGIVFMTLSLNGMPTDIKGLWATGFGKITGKNLLSSSRTFAAGVVLANLPQLLLSYLYLAFNALTTTMVMAEEWSTYARTRKPLRVTAPKGRQRSTYWLNMPFRYGIPMQVLALLFHWLTSQSIFLVRMVVLDRRDRTPSGKDWRNISTNGFSPLAIILGTALGILIAIIGIVLGRSKFSSAMPVAASCSAVISAACHPPPEDTDASVLPVQWGAVTHGMRGDDWTHSMSATSLSAPDDTDPDSSPVDRRSSRYGNSDEIECRVGHCTFSSRPVEEPKAGHFYA